MTVSGATEEISVKYLTRRIKCPNELLIVVCMIYDVANFCCYEA
jgi:hypothetical protein